MSNLELKKKAENLIKDKKWDFYLIYLFFYTKTVTDSNIQKKVYSGYTKKTFHVSQESFNNINFEIGGFVDISEDGYFQSVVLYINSKLLLHIKYELVESAEYFEIDKYKIYSVEEFHNDSLIDDLLIRYYKYFEQKKIQNEHEQRITNDMKYKNKFTFD